MNDQAALSLDKDAEPEKKLDAGDVCDLLRAKYPRDRYALFFDVPDAVSLQQRRRIDALAFGIWQSVGREIHGFEIKVSRGDWLREVKQVDKADPFIAVCDRFWLVTSDYKVASSPWARLSQTMGERQDRSIELVAFWAIYDCGPFVAGIQMLEAFFHVRLASLCQPHPTQWGPGEWHDIYWPNLVDYMESMFGMLGALGVNARRGQVVNPRW